MSADLKIILSLVDDFTRKAAGIETSMGSLGGKIDRAIGSVQKLAGAFAAVMAVDKVRDWIQASVDYGSAINDNANKLSMSVEQFQRFDYIAKQSGTTAEAMGKSLKVVTKELYDASKGSEKSRQLFAQLGVSVNDTNGNVREAGEVFEQMLLKLTEIPNPTERAAAAQRLFGKGYQEVLQIVNQGRPEVQKLIDQTREYGMVLSQEAINKLDAAGDAMTRFATISKNLNADLVVAFIPTMEKAAEWVGKLAQAWGYILNSGKQEEERKALEAKGTEIRTLRVEIEELTRKIKMVPALSNSLYLNDDPFAPSQTNAQALDAKRARIKELSANIAAGNAPATSGKSVGDFSTPDSSGKKASGKDWASELRNINTYLETEQLKSNKKQYEATADLILKQLDLNAWLKKELAGIDKDIANNKLREDERALQKKKQLLNTGFEAASTVSNAIFQIGANNIDRENRLRIEQVQNSKQSETAKKNAILAIEKETFEKKKKAAVAQILVDGAIGVGKTIASVGWPAAIPLVVLQGITTAASLAVVAAQKFARGGNAQRGLALVGEEGPELVRFNQPGYVYNASRTRQMMRDSSASSGSSVNVTVVSHRGVSESIVAELRSGGARKLERAIRDVVR